MHRRQQEHQGYIKMSRALYGYTDGSKTTSLHENVVLCICTDASKTTGLHENVTLYAYTDTNETTRLH